MLEYGHCSRCNEKLPLKNELCINCLADILSAIKLGLQAGDYSESSARDKILSLFPKIPNRRKQNESED